MTEEEAITKMCPFYLMCAVNVATKASTEESVTKAMKASKCVTSDCAMWVWDRKLLTDAQLRQQSGQLGSGLDKLGPRTGHCGLIRS